MGKRSDGFERKSRDAYFTIDPKAAARLAHHYGDTKPTFYEPCAGAGDLSRGLKAHGWVCAGESDIEPQSPFIRTQNALDLTAGDVKSCEVIVTNPPFARGILLPMIDHFITLKPTWLLLPGDIIHNKYMSPYLECCSDILAIGRMYWVAPKWVDRKDLSGVTIREDLLKSKWFKDCLDDEGYYTGWWEDESDSPYRFGKVSGKDNMCWLRFSKDHKAAEPRAPQGLGRTAFHGRV